jgi:hypothetical protein
MVSSGEFQADIYESCVAAAGTLAPGLALIASSIVCSLASNI